jgi:cyclophilin family peptidyl-prolyl cis-trans isomerase
MTRKLMLALMLVALVAAPCLAGQEKPTAQTPAKAAPAEKAAMTKNPIVLMETSMGNMKIELYPDKAPISVKNFLQYVGDKFYDGTIFHRVIDGFMIQGGGLNAEMQPFKPTYKPIKNEAANGLKNLKYTVAMARTGEIDSATCQFFINVRDNPHLDYTAPDQAHFGYAVFGKVIEGTDVVDKIKSVPTATKGPYQDVPVTPITINKVTVVQQ